jgi:hypothetical protein
LIVDGREGRGRGRGRGCGGCRLDDGDDADVDADAKALVCVGVGVGFSVVVGIVGVGGYVDVVAVAGADADAGVDGFECNVDRDKEGVGTNGTNRGALVLWTGMYSTYPESDEEGLGHSEGSRVRVRVCDGDGAAAETTVAAGAADELEPASGGTVA